MVVYDLMVLILYIVVSCFLLYGVVLVMDVMIGDDGWLAICCFIAIVVLDKNAIAEISFVSL